MTLGVDLDHFQALHGAIHSTHVARHFLAREHTTRGLTLTDRTRRAMRQRVTVGSVTHLEVVALDGALEALTLADASHVDDLADLEHFVSLDFGADGIFTGIGRIQAEFPQATTRLDFRLGVVTLFRGRQQAGALDANGDLHRGVTIVIFRLHLRHAVRRRFNQRHRNRAAVFGEESAHAAFAANQSDTHVRILSLAQPSLI